MTQIRSAILIILALSASRVSAQAIKQVEVTNLPEVQEVEVVNPPTPAAQPRFQLAGFSSGTIAANVGVIAMGRVCAVDFPASRLCSLREVIETTSFPNELQGVGWVREEIEGTSDRSLNCGAWSDSSSIHRTISADGRLGGEFCHSTVPVACCAPRTD